MARTMAALRSCRHLLDRHRVTQVRCVATEACRRAQNGPEFLRRVERMTGIRLELLGQEEEARLAMLGCLQLVDADADQLVMVDIGGGSTEIMWLDRWAPANGRLGHAISMPVGVVTLSETFGQDGRHGRLCGNGRACLSGAGRRRGPGRRRLRRQGGAAADDRAPRAP